jgi:pSer/pThr/pTyr-binding forkhead associated (FHA) protein
MEPKFPYFEVQPVDSQHYTVYLNDIIRHKANTTEVTIGRKDMARYKAVTTEITIGRSPENDIVLADPYQKISRRHCTIEYRQGAWWLVDKGSTNGTFLQRNNTQAAIDVRFERTLPLKDGDVIYILGQFIKPDRYLFVRLTFRDPTQTDQVNKFHVFVDLEYSLSQEKLFGITREVREEIKLSPQERQLIHYMARQKYENNNQPVMCTYEKLIKAVWPEPFGHTKSDINRLIWAIRTKIETDSGEPRFLKIVKGRGYILEITTIK